MQQPEAYIGGAGKLFDENGKINNDASRDFAGKFINAFAEWVVKHVENNR
jgi:chromate reductase, NAD(P)H dehydrogenase (quinone)